MAIAISAASALGFTLIADSVGLRLEEDVFDFPFLCGAVCSKLMQKDISQTRHVRNRAYEDHRAYIKISALDFLAAFCQDPTPNATRYARRFPSSHRPHAQCGPGWRGLRELPGPSDVIGRGYRLENADRDWRDGDESVLFVLKTVGERLRPEWRRWAEAVLTVEAPTSKIRG